MKTILYFFTITMICSPIWSQDSFKTISGQITDGLEPLSNVNINVKDANRGTKTDASGYYTLNTTIGDVVEYTHVGHTPIRVVIEDVTKVINLEMPKISEELTEVTVNGNRGRTQREMSLEYETNIDLIRTAYGYLDKRKSGTFLNIIDESEFLPGRHFLDAIQGKFNGRVVSPNNNGLYNVQVFLRERPNLLTGPEPAIFDIDGAIISGDSAADAALSIPVTEIRRIAILRGLNATARYGVRANGGVIIINTKTGRIKPKTDAFEVKDLETAHASFIEDNFCTPSEPSFVRVELSELFSSNSEAEAVAIYDSISSKELNDPYLRIDAANHFNVKWGNREFAKELWDTVKTDFSENPNVLKAVAYYYEENKYLKDALDIYQKISALRPDYAQTYRDLANMHDKLDNPEQALNIYTKYLNENNKPSSQNNFKEGIDFIMGVETLAVLTQNKMKVSKVLKNVKIPFKDSPTRILLEWNNGETEFDIEMVKKDKSYLVWNHNYLDSPELITAEKKLGYSMQQLILNKEEIGKWDFNIKYLGNKSADPSYMKATVQYDYGSKSQRDVVKVIRLPEQKSCLKLLSL